MVGVGKQSKKDSKERLEVCVHGMHPSANQDRDRDLAQGPPAPTSLFKVVFSNYKQNDLWEFISFNLESNHFLIPQLSWNKTSWPS